MSKGKGLSPQHGEHNTLLGSSSESTISSLPHGMPYVCSLSTHPEGIPNETHDARGAGNRADFRTFPRCPARQWVHQCGKLLVNPHVLLLQTHYVGISLEEPKSLYVVGTSQGYNYGENTDSLPQAFFKWESGMHMIHSRVCQEYRYKLSILARGYL